MANGKMTNGAKIPLEAPAKESEFWFSRGPFEEEGFLPEDEEVSPAKFQAPKKNYFVIL